MPAAWGSCQHASRAEEASEAAQCALPLDAGQAGRHLRECFRPSAWLEEPAYCLQEEADRLHLAAGCSTAGG